MGQTTKSRKSKSTSVIGSTQKFSTLVLSPLPRQGLTGRPWVGLHDGRRWQWRKSLATYGPGRVNFWSVLSRYQRSLSKPGAQTGSRPDAIVVVTDPAPFTASRAAVSIANSLGFSWNIAVVAASLTDLQRNLPRLLVERALQKRTDRGGKGLKSGFSVADRALPHYNRKPY